MQFNDWLESLFERFRPGRSRKTRAYRDRFIPILRVTRLEPRCVLNAAPIPVPVVPPAPASHNSAPLHSASNPGSATNPNVMVVAAADMLRQSPQSAPEASVVRIVREGANIDVFMNGREIESVPLAQIASIDVVGTQGPETLVVDYSGGNPLPAGGIAFESGNAAALDTLVVDGGSVQSVNLSIGARGDGSLAIDGGQIRFSGVVSLVDMLNTTTSGVALADGGQNWSLGDGPQSGQLRLESSDGTQLTLAEPQSSLTIDTRSAGSFAGDTINVGNLNVSNSPLVSIFGRQNDTVNVAGNVQLGEGGLAIYAGTETVSGTIGASGGTVTLSATSATSAITISASASIRDASGSVVVDAGATGTLLDYGSIDVSATSTGTTAAIGGSVQLLGQYVGLSGDARIDASGNSGGGTILIGGDEHGANAGVRDATRTYVGQDVSLSADALVRGNGGKIVVWSNDVTIYYGSLSARGGAAGGDGGFAEVSGAGSLNFLGNSDLSAAYGATGILLLDPTTITIEHNTADSSTDDGQLNAGTPAAGNGSTVGVIDFADLPSAMTISDGKINAIGAANNIELDATQSITANANVSVSVAHNLLFQTTNTLASGVIDLSNGTFATTGAGATITISASTTGVKSGNITLGVLTTAGGNITITTGKGSIAVNGAVGAGAGTVTLSSTTGTSETGMITAGALAVSNTTSGDITLGTANVVGAFSGSNTAGDITFSDGKAALTVNGVDTSAANNDISITNTTGSLAVAGILQAGTGNVSLSATGGISETGKITAAAVAVANTTAGDVTLGTANVVSSFSGSDTAGNMTFVDGKATLTVDGVDTSAADNDISITNTAGSIAVAGTVTAGTGTVTLSAQGGLSETGTITAGAVAVANTRSGDITLGTANVVGAFSGSDSAGNITFSDGTATLTVNGVDTSAANKNITITNTAGSLAIAGTVTAGTGTVSLSATAGISETGKITAGAVAATNTTAGDVTLGTANVVSAFSGSDTAGNITFVDGKATLTVNGVDTSAANNDISITNTAGSIAVAGNVTAGAGSVSLSATAGMTETGTISAGALAVTNTTAGNVTLGTANSVGAFSGSNTAGNITFSDGRATLTVNGVDTSAANKNITITNTAGSIVIAGSVAAGTGTVSLSSTAGITETGTITAGAVAVTNTTAGNVTLGTANAVSSFSGSNTAGNITLSDGTAALTVNSVDTSTANKNITITNTEGSLALAGTVTAGTGTATLSATAGMTETGTISAGAVAVANTTAGDVTLGTANVVSIFSGSNTTGNITFNDGIAALTVNAVDTSAAGNDISITNTAGTVAVAGTINAGAGTVTLTSAGAISETGKILAADLAAATTAGNVTLGSATNSVATFAARDSAVGGTITFNDAAALTVGTVSGVVGLRTNSSGITLVTAGALTLSEAVSTGSGASGTVRLQAAGDVTQAARGFVTGLNLGVYDTTGNVTLDQANKVGTLATAGTIALQNTGGTIVFVDTTTGTAQTGTVSSSGPFSNTVTGVVSNAGNITLSTAGALTLNQAVSTGSSASGTVLLQATGDVTQAAAGIITGLNLGVNTAVGDIVLGLAPNVVGGTFGATATTGDVEFRDTVTYNPGNVAAVLGLFLGANGITASPAGNITLISDTSLNVTSALSTTGTVRLQAAGDLTQSAAITAGSLGASVSSGYIDLENAGNSVLTIAAQDTDGTTPGTITFLNSLVTPLTVGTVTAAADGSTSTLTGVVSNTGNITLSTAGALTLNQRVSAGSATSGTVRLQAAGDITQAAAGVITGLNLGLNISSGNIVLGLDPNAVSGTFGATATTGSVEFRDSVTNTQGAVTAVAGLFSGANGISVAASGNITLISDTSLNVNSVLSTTGIVRLQAAGDITQTAAFTAGSLGVSTSLGKIDLENASNIVSTFAAHNTDGTTPGTITFNNSIATALAVGTVTAAADGSTSAVTGVVSNKGNITLSTAGALTLNLGVSTGSGASGTVRLQAAGDITQATGEIITAASLGVYDTAGNITLDQANLVGTAGATGTVAMQNTSGTIVFKDATTGTLQTGPVTSSGIFTNTVTGVVSNTANVTLSTAGALTLNQAVSTGSSTSGTVRLQAAGAITQAAAGIITGLNLGTNTTAGDIVLGLAPNVVGGTFGATATTGNVEFRDSLTSAPGTVTAVPGLFLGASGITVSPAGNITLISDTSLIVTSVLVTTGTVRLQAAGDVTQSAAIVAGSLGASTSSGNIDLENTGNIISTFSAQNTDGATPGTITFKDSLATPLTIGTVAAAADGSTGALTGVISNAGNITLSTLGALSLSQVVSTGSGASGTVRLQAAGDVTQAASGIITALNLGLNTSLGDVVLGLAPNVIGGTLGATATTGSVEFRDSLTLTIGDLTPVPGLFLGANGITVSPAGNITLISDTSLNVNSVLTTTGTVRLQAAGDITQTTAITAGALGVSTSSGKIDLENSGNSFAILAARDTDGTATPRAIIINDSIVTPLIVGTVAAAADGSTSAVTALASNTGNITLTTAGALTLSQGVSTGSATTGTVRLQAAGGVLQTSVDAPGRIMAGALDVFATAGAIQLQNQSNSVATIDLELPAGATNAISYAAAGNFAIQKITTAGNATLNSRNGSILNGNAGDPNEVAAQQLLLMAPGGGIGTAGDLLRTSAASLGAVAGSGGVYILNNGSLTIENVPPATGITAAAGGIDIVAAGNLTIAGSVVLVGPGSVSLAAEALNGAVGDFTLATGGSISAPGNIVITASHDFNATPLPRLSDVVDSRNGTVSINAGNTSNIVQPSGALNRAPLVPGFTIQTGTGITSTLPPFLVVTPLFVSPGVAISIDGKVSLEVTIGRPIDTNMTLVVNWGDGTSFTLTGQTAGTQIFTHTFLVNAIEANTTGGAVGQLGGTTAFAPTVTLRGDPSLAFVVHGQPVTASQRTLLLIAPGLGLAGTNINSFGSRGFINFIEEEVPVVGTVGASIALANTTAQFANQTSPGEATAAGVDKLVLRVGPTDASQKDDQGDSIELSEEDNIDIKNLTSASIQALFSKLPDGRYRLMWQHGAGAGVVTERVIFDVLLRDGKPINFDDLEKPPIPTNAAPPKPAARLAEPGDAAADQARIDLPFEAGGPLLGVAEFATIQMVAASLSSGGFSNGQSGENSLTNAPGFGAVETGLPGPHIQSVPDDPSTEYAEATDETADANFRIACGLAPVGALIEMALLRQRRKCANEPAAASPDAELFSRVRRLGRLLRRKTAQLVTADSNQSGDPGESSGGRKWDNRH